MITDLERLILGSDTLAPLRSCLSDYPNRVASPIPRSFYDDIDRIRTSALESGNQALAKAVWCLESIGHAQDQFTEAFRLCKHAEFYQGWCFLERCEITLQFLRSHYDGGGDVFAVGHMLKQVPRFQDLFPYEVFFSPAYVIRGSKCSICGQPIRLRSDCGHRRGEIYNGEMCSRIITATEVLELSIVRNPVQKYSVALGVRYNYGPIHYVIQCLESPWHSWSCEKQEIETSEPRFAGVGRNERCPCGSKRKFKRCCLGKTRRREHFQVQFSVPPPEGFPGYVENIQHIVLERGPSSSFDAKGPAAPTEPEG